MQELNDIGKPSKRDWKRAKSKTSPFSRNSKARQSKLHHQEDQYLLQPISPAQITTPTLGITAVPCAGVEAAMSSLNKNNVDSDEDTSERTDYDWSRSQTRSSNSTISSTEDRLLRNR